MIRQAKFSVLVQVCRLQKKSTKQIAEALGITQVTALKYLRHPNRMDGVMRRKMAAAVGIEVRTMDDICNRQTKREKVLKQLQERVIEASEVKPVK